MSPSGRDQAYRPALVESRLARLTLIGVALGFLTLFLFIPLGLVFASAFKDGLDVYLASISEPDAVAAIELTLVVALIAVPLNVIFGLAAAWAVTKHDFVGKGLLLAVIDLPFAVSPVISGMVFILLFGASGLIGPWLMEEDIKIVFALPGIVLATIFVTFPYVARELIPAMEARGKDQELAALTLGATGLQTFRRVTLPNVRWALMHGVVLCTARAVGEFGAVSVVSGHIRGETNTMPLHIEILYNEYQFTAAFAVATLLVLVAVITLALKTFITHRESQRRPA
ncbi:MAG: sulfate ABC transporter permease subunit CysW [Deltaproteobacteria bacterium]|nr:sulfate ABC transporter permease subunit CysW [Deltaproteobacteria bacterium]